MLVAIGYCTKDEDQAERLAGWMAELGPYPNHRLLVARDVRAKENVFANAGFASVKEIVITDDAWDAWPQSCNNVFRKVGKHIEFGTKEPFLWIEADVAPMREGWIDAIAAEYAQCGKPFMGDRVEVENVPLHMSGVAVYPGIMSNHAGLAYLAQDIAWDCAAAAQIVPQAHFTTLIEHAWKHPTFESWEHVEREIAPETLLYHASKDGSLLRLLRERKNNLAGGLNAGAEVPSATPSLPGHLLCDIFIKTYPPDYPWLKYCLRSVQKFAHGFNALIIAAPDLEWLKVCDEPPLVIDRPDLPLVDRKFIKEEADGYLGQQKEKLYADEQSAATFLCFLDSDTIFTRPVTPQTYFRDGRIVWMMTPWENTNTPWKPIVEKFMGQPVEHEYMRRLPVICPRWLLAAVREFCLKQHNMPLDQYVMSQPHRAFSEFNVLGAFAYAFHRDQFHWVNTEEVPESEWPELTVLQKFSWGGLTDEVKQEFEAVLKGGDASCQSAPAMESLAEQPALDTPMSQSLTTSDAAPTFKPDSAAPQQVPWESKEQSLATIRRLACELKNFGDNAAHVRAVRLELHKMGVIELPYRFRKRKGKWRRKVKK